MSKKKELSVNQIGLIFVLVVLSMAGFIFYKMKSNAASYDNYKDTYVEEITDVSESDPVLIDGEEGSARLALVIDDWGYDVAKLNYLEGVKVPLTIAVIPFLRNTKETALMAAKMGYEVIVHMPMEPKSMDTNKPGYGALLTDMDATDIRTIVANNIKNVPNAVGVNNHMGSHFTENENLMKVALSAVKKKGLFFVDSRTSAKSVGYDTAKKLKMKTAKRNVFLDNERNDEYIKTQLYKAVEIAKKNGSAIAIGHHYKETLRVLKQEIANIEKDGVQIVKVSELTH